MLKRITTLYFERNAIRKENELATLGHIRQFLYAFMIVIGCMLPLSLFAASQSDTQTNTQHNGVFEVNRLGTIDGFVYDSSSTHPPLSGVIVRTGNSYDTTDANGFFSFGNLTGGNHTFYFSRTCYQSDSILTYVDTTQTDTIQFFMLHPELTTDQSSIELIGQPGQTFNTTLTLHNGGNSDLHWQGVPITYTDFDKASSANKSPHSRNTIERAWAADSFGYRAMDNDDVNFPGSLMFTDISRIGEMVVSGVNTGARITFDDSMSFRYYGFDFPSVWVCTNGFVQFSPATTTRSDNIMFPTNQLYNIILVLHDPLSTTVYKYYDPGQNIYFIQWNGILAGYPADTLIFQLQMHFRNHALVFEYNHVVSTHLTASVGIQNFGGFGGRYLQLYYNTSAPFPHSLDNYAIAVYDTFDFPSWMSISPRFGTIPPHQSTVMSIQATLDSNITSPAFRNGNIYLTSDACPSQTTIPISFYVNDAVRERSTNPTQFTLFRNYPNPFNPSTDIQFALSQPGMTRLTVFDTQGRTVAELLNEMLPAGNHLVRFTPANLTSGVYFYRLESGNLSEVKKMIFMK